MGLISLGKQKSNFQKNKMQIATGIEQLKQIDTLANNYSSSLAVELLPLFRASKDHSTPQP